MDGPLANYHPSECGRHLWMLAHLLRTFLSQLLQGAGPDPVLAGADHPVLDVRGGRLRPAERGRGPGGRLGGVRAREARREDGHVPRRPPQGKCCVRSNFIALTCWHYGS